MKKSLFYALLLIMSIGCKDYHGCIEGDCENGYGTYLYNNGGTDKGTWVDGAMNGYGFQVQGKGDYEGDTYTGFFKDGLYHGTGTYYFSKYDTKLIGSFKKGQAHGYCTAFFEPNSNWSGTYTGFWNNGSNPEFDNYISTSKEGKKLTFSPLQFYDTICYYYNYSNIKGIIFTAAEFHKCDLTKEEISFDDLGVFIDSFKVMQSKLYYSLEMLMLFEEYDTTINFKEVTYNYLKEFDLGFKNEFSNWILYIQHDPSAEKPYLIYEGLLPFVQRVKENGRKWDKTKNAFLKKYNLY